MKRKMMMVVGVALAALGLRAELKNADFEQVDEKGKCLGWYLPPKFKQEKGVGSNGSGGVKYASADDTFQGNASQRISVEPGATYRFGAWVKAEDVTGKGPCFICLGFHDANNKWIGESRSDAVRRSTNGEWVRLEGVSSAIPTNAVHGMVALCVQNTLHGRFFFDKVYCERFMRAPVVAVYSSSYRDEACAGDVHFAAALTREAVPADAKALFAVRTPDGKTFSVAGEMSSLRDAAKVTIPVVRLGLGTNAVVCAVTSGERVIGKAKTAFVRLAAPAKRRVMIDRYGRTLLDGKPFFPFGMYTGRTFFKEANFARYREAAFNCFMQYGHPSRKELDTCAKAGLYSIQDIAAWYTQPDKGTNSVLSQLRVKDHPALLAWYMFDEQPTSCVPVLNDRYRLVAAQDPHHPIWCAQDIFSETRHYIGACDVFGGDPYPISKRPITRATTAIREETAGLLGMRPIWQVVQYFGWNWHDAKQAHQRRPSEQEFRNMTWQAIAGGARGLIYYSYGYLCDKTELCGEKVDDLWAEMKRVAGEVRQHERVLLFAETQAMADKDLPAGVVGRVFREAGEEWKLLVNTTTNAMPSLALEPLGISMKPSKAVAAPSGLDAADLIGTTDRRAIDYKVGEPMKLTLTLRGAKDFEKGTWFLAWNRTGDDGKSEHGKVPLENLPFTYTTTLDRPGFFRMCASVTDAKGKTYRKKYQGDTTTPEGREAMNRFERGDNRIFFDGGAGADTAAIRSVEEPRDFDAFWARRRARLAKVPMEATCTPIAKQWNNYETMYAVSVKCAGPRPTTGYLTIPKKPGKYPIYVLVHGYGHTYPNKGHVVHPISGEGKRIAFYFSPHGYELGREPEYYDEFFRSICSGGKTFCFDEKQNADPETSYFSGYTYRLMRALEYLKTRPEWNGQDITVEGGSMGGMQSLWAAALEPAVTLAKPGIPWNCDMGGRDTLKRIIDGWYIHETPALRYYDPVNLAKRIPKTCTVDVTRAGLGDYCCPPSGVMAMWNALTCPKRIRWVQGSTHGHVPAKPNDEILVSAGMPTIFFAGDSTLDDYGVSRGAKGRSPYASWGTTLRTFLKPHAQIWNFAQGGHSTKMFIARGVWGRLIREVRAGDFVVIQFGHNDQKHATDEQRKTLFAPPQTDYKANLRRFAAEVRAKGATPVFCTPIVRGSFDDAGKKLVDTTWAGDGITLGAYATAVRELGAELKVDVVDMQKMTGDICERVGRDEANKFFVISTGLTYSKDGEPSKDITHPVQHGAETFARLFRDDVMARHLSIATLFHAR